MRLINNISNNINNNIHIMFKSFVSHIKESEINRILNFAKNNQLHFTQNVNILRCLDVCWRTDGFDRFGLSFALLWLIAEVLG